MVTPVLQLLTEIVVIIGISILLFLIEPLVTLLIIMGFSIFSWLAHVKFRNPITQWGRLRQMHEGMRIQYAQQGLGGVKELKILGREDGVSNQYLEHNFGSANVSTKKATVQLLPRLWLEFMAITSLGLVVLVMLSQERPMPSLIATIAMFGVAAFRLMPSVNRVLASMQSFRYGIPVIHNLYEEICAIDKSMPNNSINIKFQDTIEINKVFYRYPEAAKYALKDVNLVIPYGTSVGFIGDTGMGKSTLIDVILGLLNPDSGSILVDGVEIQTQLRGWQDKIGYVPQAIFLSDETLRKNIAFGLPDDEIDDNTIDEVLKATQLFNFVQQLPNGLDTFVGERGVRLSGGQRQRIGIARALYCRPSVLVLDEATNSLDGVTEARVMESVFALKDITLIIIAHRLSTVANCDKLYRLNFGEVVESDSIKGSY